MRLTVITLSLTLIVAVRTDATPGPQELAATRPSVMLALSGGGARGFAHIGVLAGLEECGVPVDGIAGTSMGAIVGGLYAIGYSTGELVDIAVEASWASLFRGGVDSERRPFERVARGWPLLELDLDRGGLHLPSGLVNTTALEALLVRLTLSAASETTRFDGLTLPFRAVATDLETGERVSIDHGPLWRALRASMAVPGIFAPVELEGRLLLDGGIVDNLPVDDARALGGDLVIAVDVSSPLDSREGLNSFTDVLNQVVSFQIRTRRDASVRRADFVLTPDLHDLKASSFDLESIHELIERGRDAARACCAEIRQQVGEYVAPRPRPPRHSSITIGDVSVEGVRRGVSRLAMKELGPLPADRTLTHDQLASRLLRFQSIDMFASVDLALTGDAGETQNLRLDVDQVAPMRVRFGARYDDKTLALARASVTWRRMTGPIRGLTFDATLGNQVIFALEARHDRLFTTSWWFSGRAFHSDTFDDLVIDKSDSGKIDFERLGLVGDLGTSLGRSLEATFGYHFEKTRTVIEPTFSADTRSSSLLSQLVARLRLDSTDRLEFPDGGARADARLTVARRWLGGDEEFARLDLSAATFVRLGARTVLYFRAEAAARLDGVLPIASELVAGGNDRLPGYTRDEFRGDRMVLGSIAVWHELTQLPATLGRALRLGVNLGAGTLDGGDRTRSARGRLHYGFAARLAADTRVGVFEIAYGLGRDARQTVTMSAGPRF